MFPSARFRRPARRAARRLTIPLCLALAGAVSAAAQTRPAGAVIPIHGEINDILADSVFRRIEDARQQGVKVLIFEMNTPGGLVTSAIELSKRIKRLPDEGIATVAWIREDAYSAGALISIAAQQIVMSSTGRIGDCAPILISPGGGLVELGETERAKVESPVLQEFRDSAARNGYDQVLTRAMVTAGAEVWWLERIEGAERRFVHTEEKDLLVGGDSPEWRLVTTYVDPLTNGEQPVKQPVDGASELLTLSQSEAVAFGLARAIVRNEAELQSFLTLSAAPVRLEITGWEAFALWLNRPFVRGFLFVLVLLGAYTEFKFPGLIVPGAIALVSLAIFLAAPYAAGLANVWTFVLLGIGFILLAVELFVLPGFGIAGILGILLILLSFVGTFVPGEPGAPPLSLPSTQAAWDALKVGFLTMMCSVVIAFFGIILVLRYFPSLPIARHFLLENPVPTPAVAAAAGTPLVQAGDVGVVLGPLRPGGQARFGHDVVEVSSQGEYVDSGTRVQVIRCEGMAVVVRPLPPDEHA